MVINIFIHFSLLVAFFFGSQERNFTAPPGTIKVGDNLFIDKTINHNVDWAEFMYYRINVDKLDIKSLTPDSSASTYFKRSNQTWDTIRKYDHAPTTGISYEQALEYCRWRSEIVTQAKNELSPTCKSCRKMYRKYMKFDPKNEYRIEYRLPTEEEWAIIYEKMKKDKMLYKAIITGTVWEMLDGGRDVYLHTRNARLDYPGADANLGFRCIASYVRISGD